jgi:PAS domain S-box-containing protein
MGRFRGELTFIRSDGTKAEAEISTVLLKDKNGFERTHMVVRDITERKKAEEALRLSEERFAKAFRLSPDAIILSRMADGQIIEVNPAWERLFGFQPQEVIGRSSVELNLFADPADRQRAIARLQLEGSARDFELRIRRKSGELRHAILSVEKIDLRGEPCLLTVLRDITERKQAEEALRIRARQQAAIVRLNRPRPAIFHCRSLPSCHVASKPGGCGEIPTDQMDFRRRTYPGSTA